MKERQKNIKNCGKPKYERERNWAPRFDTYDLISLCSILVSTRIRQSGIEFVRNM